MNRSESGFTLVELLVSMAMAGIVVGIIYAAYTVQTKIYTEQGKVAEMQQNIRAAVTYLRHEGVMAGYNPQGEKHASCGPGGRAGAVRGLAKPVGEPQFAGLAGARAGPVRRSGRAGIQPNRMRLRCLSAYPGRSWARSGA